MEIILGASTVRPASLLAAVGHECGCHSSLNSLQCPGHPGGFILVGFHVIRTSTKVLSVGDNEFQAFPQFRYNSVVVVTRIQQLFLSSNEDCSTPYDTLFLFFLVLFAAFNVCDEHHRISLWTEIFLSPELIFLNRRVCVCVWHWGVVGGGRDGICVTPVSWCNSHLTRW